MDNDEGMDAYGWGTRIEEWASTDHGATWTRTQDLTPKPGLKYQNIKAVHPGLGNERLLFYAWKDTSDTGTAYLWKGTP